MAKFGGDLHINGDILDLDSFREAFFPDGLDLVFLNGVIGFGLDAPSDIQNAFRVISRHLKTEGQLVVGTNPRFISQSALLELTCLKESFNPIPLVSIGKPQVRFDAPYQKEGTHEYLLLARR